MINGIKLVFFDKSHQVRKLHCYYSCFFQGNFHSSDKIVDIRYMCQHVVTKNQISPDSLINKILLSKAGAKKIDNGINAFLNSCLSCIGCWINSENRHLIFFEIL